MNVTHLPRQFPRYGSFISFFMAALFACAVFAAGADDEPISIHRIAAAASRHTYDAAHPPPQMPTTQPDEAGVTVSDFSCVAHVTGQTHVQENGQITVTMSSIHITLNLKVTEWIDELAPQKIWAHEDGHRDIALIFYQHADTTAAMIARNWFNQTLTFPTPEAAKKALDEAAKKIAGDYMTQVRDQSELVQEAYDRITAHGTNDVDEYDAIQQALAEVQKSHQDP